jgi:2-(1,2-epoxy-1,2-dihydrophenyl)acetyl-CoA isomerase
MIMSEFPVLMNVRNNVATLTLNRPEALNAVNYELGLALCEVLRQCQDPMIRCVVLVGAGKVFSVGGDLREMTGASDASETEKRFRRLLERVNEAVVCIRNLEKPVIAALNGTAAGVGLNLALMCDLRVANEKARFTQAFLGVGLVPDGGGSFSLPRLVGSAKALELLWFNRVLDAQEALTLGLVNRVVPEESFSQVVEDWANQLAQGPKNAMALTKRLVYEGLLTEDLSGHLDKESMAQIESSKTADFREGVSAFLGKRSPRFQWMSARVVGSLSI